jgi:hypothetical protein
MLLTHPSLPSTTNSPIYIVVVLVVAVVEENAFLMRDFRT